MAEPRRGNFTHHQKRSCASRPGKRAVEELSTWGFLTCFFVYLGDKNTRSS